MKITSTICKLIFLTNCLLSTNCTDLKKKDILYVNSYHEGYPSSDQIMKAIKTSLDEYNTELDVFFLDSKRDTDPRSIKKLAYNIYRVALETDPDLLILSDDNAVKYFGEVYGDNLQIPIIFCGVNWDHSGYRLPPGLFTGMLEVLPVRECIEMISKNYPGTKKLGILSENTLSERKNKVILDTLTGLDNDYRLIYTFEEWKESFIQLNESADLIFLPTNGAVKNWNSEEAKDLVKKYARVPVFTCDEFMMEYCMAGMTKITEEQGRWAAETAIRVLNGEKISTIPVVKNQEFQCWFNIAMSGLIRFKLSSDVECKNYPQ